MKIGADTSYYARKRKMGAIATAIMWLGVALLAAAVMGSVFLGLVNITEVGYKYQSAVHSHMENAYNSADPATMRSEIMLAKQGMVDSGLQPEMYDAFWQWEKTPDRQMKWQYKHLDSVLTRIDEFESWERSQNTTVSSQQMQDVYTAKLDNVRHYIQDDGGWSDWIAEGAFILNNYFWTIVMKWALLGAFILSMIMLVFGFALKDF